MTYYIYVWSLSLKRAEPLYVLHLFFFTKTSAKLKKKSAGYVNSMEMDAC